MQLDVAAYGWLDDGWTPSYPDDLPLDWRLDYYANEFRSIIVPHGHWKGLDDEALLEWLEEAHQEFTFYWELAAPDDAQRLLSLYRAQPDAPSPGGWLLLPESHIDPASELELSDLAPVAHCDRSGRCSGGIRTLAVEEGANLRRLREQLDVLKEEGATVVLLLVMPSPAAAISLEQLQTLCQLYSG